MDMLIDTMRHLLGFGRDLGDVSAAQMAFRTVVVYAASLAIVRLGSRRFLGRASAFDMLVAIMFGSIMSRPINGTAPLSQTLLSGAVLIAAHWLLAASTYRFGWIGTLVKGKPIRLIADGEVDRDAMRRAGVSDHDLEQALRAQARLTDPSGVRLAILERDGSISVLPIDTEPRVVEVNVAHGVQTVRVQL